MARIVLTTIGSMGDLYPMFPVADSLQKRGHTISFVVPESLHSAVTGEGFISHPVRLPKQPTSVDQSGHSPSKSKAEVRDNYGPWLQRCIEVLEEACDGVDAILTTPHQLASAIVAERRHIPWATLTVFPGLIPSSYTVPEPHWLPALPTPAGRVVNNLTWKVFAFGLRYLASDTIDATVGAQGMAVNRKLFKAGGLSPHLCLVLSSPLYSPRQPDWPAEIKVTGYTPWDQPSAWREPPELATFLAAGPPPVVVTTSSARNSALFLSIAKQAVEASGRRGIILTGRATPELLGKADHVVLDTGVAAWRYVPLSHLLPRAAVVVHHAGIGTGITTIRHGLPAVAIPFSFDQWYNANRIRALGVGRVVSGAQAFRDGELRYKHLDVQKLASEIDQADRDPKYRARAQELARKMEVEDGPAAASDEIEALLRKQVPAARNLG